MSRLGGTPPAVGPPIGAVRFVRYAYPPNALGYCGPDDAGELLELASAGGRGRGIGSLAARFEGAWPYLQLIAGYNAVSDPLDERVVGAYWVGNALLDRVPTGALLASVRDRFGRRVGRDLDALSAAVVLGAGAHHSFHVFGVYPWLGMLRAGRSGGVESGIEGAALSVLDRCRIRWGTVVGTEAGLVTVLSRRLAFDGHRVVLGACRLEQVRRGPGGPGLGRDVIPGDVVSMHWDWMCERLSGEALGRLRLYTARTLRAVNAAPAPGPAVICERLGA